MSPVVPKIDANQIQATLSALNAAQATGKLSASAVANIRTWLDRPEYAEYLPQVLQHIAQSRWRELDDAFWTVIPFGTAGRRGRMYPIGTATINDRTIGESVQGFADYVSFVTGHVPSVTGHLSLVIGEKQNTSEQSLRNELPRTNDQGPRTNDLQCAIAYDTRHRSRHLAELSAEIMVAAGFKVLMFDGFRATPELSFTVRDQHCDCGIMISASHNPPSDNAIKAFWCTGGQIRAPHDEGIIQCVNQVHTINRVPFAEALAAEKVTYCQDQLDSRYRAAVLGQAQPGPRDIRILYSPLHGVGLTSVLPVLQADGFHNIEVYEPHAKPDGDFPNVPGHVANPENPAVFDSMILHAQTSGAELILASDPDADRIGCAAPLSSTHSTSAGSWLPLSGNQIGVLIGEFLLRKLQAAGKLTPEHYIIKTLVTSDMICRVAQHFGVKVYGDVLTGFKWIGSKIDEIGPANFVFGFEEAHGYLAGTYARDKDGAVAAMLLAELAAECKTDGRTLHEHLDGLMRQYGCHVEKTISQTLPGADGLAKMNAVMQRLRTAPSSEIGGLKVQQVRDYLQQQVLRYSAADRKWIAGGPNSLPGEVPKSDLLIFDLEPSGNRVAIRPSGTEPKLKFYFFTYEPPEQSTDLAAAKARLSKRLSAMEADCLRFSG